MVSTIPVAGTFSIFKPNEDSKERILFTLQIAVKQIQHYCSLQNEDDVLTVDVKEVRQLCEGLDKALFHGLKCYDKGYWSFVKEFTRSNTIKFLKKLENVHTELQCGRAWLCLALNESSLESYFRSFMQNSHLVRKYYESPALICDEQRMQLVLMLMAGLEYVPINLNEDKISFGSGLCFFGDHLYTQNSSVFENPECSPSKKSDIALQVAGSADVPCDSAVEVTSYFSVVTDTSPSEYQNSIFNFTNKSHKSNSGVTNNGIGKTVRQQDLEMISHYINIDADSEVRSNPDLEVIRTKVVRRTKRSYSQKNESNDKTDNSVCHKNNSSDCKNQPLNDSFTSLENRLSKTTMDSGLCLETPCSSESDLTDFTDDNGLSECHQTSFKVKEFHQDLSITFSTPRDRKELVEQFVTKSYEDKSSLEERGAPEGEEDPVKNMCCSQNIDRLPLSVGSDGADEDEAKSYNEEEEISIYDVSKLSFFVEPSSLESPMISKESAGSEVKSIASTCSEKSETVDIVLEEMAKLAAEKPEEIDLRVGNNILLYFLVEVYEHEEESYYKLYSAYSSFSEGFCQRVYFLLSNKGVYFLKPGNNQQKFFKCGGLRYSSIDYIMVELNYQSFKVVSRSKEHFPLYTANEELTRNILSNLELGIRRFIPKLPLPSVYTDATVQTIILSKFLASELHCDKSDIVLSHYVLARWEDYTSSSVTPSGPIYQDYLMYRHKFAKENEATLWKPAYFLLKGGVLYCMENEKSKPMFFIQMCAPHCKGCRRIHLLNRPHAFEILRSNSDSLQLAASDTYEASKWLQHFLETVSLAGHFIDTERSIQKPCCVILANSHIVIATEDPRKNSYTLLSKASIHDLVTVFIDPVAPNYIMLEFEIAEAFKSSGEWIIYFESTVEKEKFLDLVSQRWSKIFQVSLSVEYVKDLYLLKRYRQFSEELKAEKVVLQEFCTDN